MAISRTHHHDGTVGTAGTATLEGYDTFSGTNPTYATPGVINQCLEWTSGASPAYLQDNVAGGYVTKMVQFPTALPLSDLGFVIMQDSGGVNLGAVVVNSIGKVVIYNGLTTLQQTSTTTLAVGTWYWFAWHCDGGSQELRIGTTASSTPVETLTGTAAAGTAARYRVGNPWTNKRGTAGDKIRLDEVQVGDAFIIPTFGNNAPTADAGPDQPNIAAGATVTLNGTGSFDPDGDPITYAWTQTAGTAVTLSSTTAAQPTFTAPSTGSAQILTFSLVVTDSHAAASAADTVNVDVLAAGGGTVLQSYSWHGTPGATVTTGNTGFASITGSMVFSSTGAAIEVADGVQAFGQDQTAGDYCAIWLSVPALPTTTSECVATAMNGATFIASVRVNVAGTISIYSGLGTLVATTTATITAGTRYRLEWNTRTDGQELRLYAVHGSTALDTITGVVASALATNQRRFGHPQASQSGVVDIYGATINSGWPNATNTAPIANAGPDQIGAVAGTTITLNGTGSADQNGDSLTYAWTQTAGPTVTLSSTTAAQPTFTAPSTSLTLTFSLVVTDSQGTSSTADTVNVTVGNNLLKSYTCDGAVGALVTTGNSGFATVSGTVTYNSTGTGIEVADGVQAFVQDQTAGDFCAIWLSVPALPTASDNCVAVAMNGATFIASVRVNVAGTISIYSGLSTLVSTTTATITPGTRYRLEWNTRTDGQELRLYTLHGSTPVEAITGGVPSALTTNQRRFGHPQTTQSSGVVDTYQITINSGWPNAVNTPPVANAGPDQSNVPAGATVTLNGTGSVDQDGDPITYAWTQTAGDPVTLSSTTAAQPTFTAPSAAAQTLTFSLVVTDNQGASSAADTISVGVLAIPASNLKIRIGGSFVSATEKVRINGVWVLVTTSVLASSGGGTDTSIFGDIYVDTYSIVVGGDSSTYSTTYVSDTY